MPRSALALYTSSVIAVGGLVVLASIAGLAEAPHLVEWFFFALFAILTGMIRIASIEASISVSDTFFITSAMLFGPAPATVALALDGFVFSWRRRHSWQRVAFNAVAPALAMWAAAHAFFALSDVRPLSVAIEHVVVGGLLLPLLCLTVIYFLLNSGLTAVAVGLESGRSAFQVWRSHFLGLALAYLAAASVALCLVVVIQQVGPLAVAVILPVVAIFHLTLRASFGRLEDANRHVTQIDRLYKSTVETLAMAIDAKDDVTHSHVRRVQAYASALARELAVTDEPTLKAIEAAALLHDTGKLAVPERILNKPGGLTPSEFEEMKRHVEIGANILSLVNFPYDVRSGGRRRVHSNQGGRADRPRRSRRAARRARADRQVAAGRSARRSGPGLGRPAGDGRRRDARLREPRAAGVGRGGDERHPRALDAPRAAPRARRHRRLVPGGRARRAPRGGRRVRAGRAGAARHDVAGGREADGLVAANRQVIVNSDAALDLGERASRAIPALDSCLAVPLAAGQELVGVLTLYGSGPNAFTDDHGRLIQVVAPHLGAAIHAARQGSEPRQPLQPSRELRLVSSPRA